MGFRFKDDKIKKIFDEHKSEDIESENQQLTNEDMKDLYDEFMTEDDINETINEELQELETLNTNSPQDLIKIENTINRIESKQNTILKILKDISITNNKKIKQLKKDELDLLVYNLDIFNKRLIIINSSTQENEDITELLQLLNQISEYLLSNSFYIFMIDSSPVKKALNILDDLVIDKIVTKSEFETRELLRRIDKISSMEIFEQNYYYANLLLEKGLLLQSIILLNEAVSIYIIESVKGFSKEIEKYTCLIGEQDIYKLYSQAKDFFISLFPIEGKGKIIPLFPHHKIVKDLDNEIANKFTNLHNTRKNKGDIGVFEKYSYIIIKVRNIRNNLAHGNMEINFYNLKKDMFELIKDFEYLSIKKNIFKYKKRK